MEKKSQISQENLQQDKILTIDGCRVLDPSLLLLYKRVSYEERSQGTNQDVKKDNDAEDIGFLVEYMGRQGDNVETNAMKQNEEESKETGKEPETEKKGGKGSKGKAKPDEPEADLAKAKSIHEMAILKSGSSATEEQFLAFRIILPNPKSINELSRPIGYQRKAQKVLKDLPPFEHYIKHIRERKKSIPPYKSGGDKLGVFQAVRKYQLQVEVGIPEQPMEDDSLVQSQNIWLDPADDFAQAAASDTSHEAASKSPSVPDSAANPSTVVSVSTRTAACDQTWRVWEPTRDEQIVNQALITFLDAITMNIPDVKCGWSMAQVAFKGKLKFTSMEARTDGYLGLADSDRTVVAKEETTTKREHLQLSRQKQVFEKV